VPAGPGELNGRGRAGEWGEYDRQNLSGYQSEPEVVRHSLRQVPGVGKTGPRKSVTVSKSKEREGEPGLGCKRKRRHSVSSFFVKHRMGEKRRVGELVYQGGRKSWSRRANAFRNRLRTSRECLRGRILQKALEAHLGNENRKISQ